MADKLHTWTVLKNDGTEKKIKAARMERDGSGVRFYDPDGSMVTAYQDGVVKSTERDD